MRGHGCGKMEFGVVIMDGMSILRVAESYFVNVMVKESHDRWRGVEKCHQECAWLVDTRRMT